MYVCINRIWHQYEEKQKNTRKKKKRKEKKSNDSGKKYENQGDFLKQFWE